MPFSQVWCCYKASEKLSAIVALTYRTILCFTGSSNVDENELILVSPWDLNTVEVQEHCGDRPPSAELKCKCPYDCKLLGAEEAEQLKNTFAKLTFTERQAYLAQHVNAFEVKRRRSTSSKRKATFEYSFDVHGKTLRVCRATFLQVLKIGRKTLQLALKNCNVSEALSCAAWLLLGWWCDHNVYF